MKMIVGKRQIILAALIVALGAAIYINATFAPDPDMLIAETASDGEGLTAADAGEGENYGDAQLVSGSAQTNEAMAEARINRQKSRDLTIETLQTMLDDTELSEEEKQTMVDTAAEVALSIETETNIENLIMAKGFADCMAYMTDENVRVVIYAPSGLSVSEATQIKDIVVQQAGIKGENVSIVEVK